MLLLLYVTFFSFLFFFVFFSSTSFYPTIVSCQHRVHLSLVSHLLVSRRSNKTNTQKNLVKSQRTKLRIIRIEYELNLTNNWELNLTREPQRNWIRLFPLRRLWMLRPLRKRPAWPGKVLWSIGNLRPH